MQDSGEKIQPRVQGICRSGGGGEDEETRDGAVYSWCHDPARTAISGRCHGVIVSEWHEAAKLFAIETSAQIVTSGFRCGVNVLRSVAVTGGTGDPVGRNLRVK